MRNIMDTFLGLVLHFEVMQQHLMTNPVFTLINNRYPLHPEIHGLKQLFRKLTCFLMF